MAQKEFDGSIAYEWELWVGRTVSSALVWTQVYGFESLPFPEQVPEDEDVTHMQSPNNTKETIPGMLPVADWSQEKQLWATDDGDILLEELSALTAAGTKEDVLFEFNMNPTGTAIRRTYRGYVNSYTPTGSVGGKAMASLSAKILDRQPTDERVIA